jgi:hypothetical protein
VKIVIFGLTIRSSWGNGHATLWRGLCRALIVGGPVLDELRDRLGVRAGESYVDVGTLRGFRRAVAMLSEPDDGEISDWSAERADIR